MHSLEGMHPVSIAQASLRGWVCCVTLIASVMATEAATIDSPKAIKVEKLLTLIRVSELESEYDSLTQKYVSDYEQQIRKTIVSTYPNLAGEKRSKSINCSMHSCRTSGNRSGRLRPSMTI